MTTTTTTAPPSAPPATAVPATVILAPVNEPGIAVLDGTPAEAAYRTLCALDNAAEALNSQREACKNEIKAVMGNMAIATLRNEPIVDWTWSSTTTVQGALLKALDPTMWAKVTRTTPRRAFNLKKNRQKTPQA
jgi:hypothetical protein